MLDEFLVLRELYLFTCFTKLAGCADLVGQMHFEEVLFLLCRLQVALDLVKCLFWAKVWFIIQTFNQGFLFLDLFLFSDLMMNVIAICNILLDTISVLEFLLPVDIVKHGIELLLLSLT